MSVRTNPFCTNLKALKIAFLTTDNREAYKDYGAAEPYFGTAPTALLQGFMQQDDIELHVVSCVRKLVSAPKKIAPNIFYHAVIVPKIGWLRTGYQGCIRAIRRRLKAIQPDIVHGQGTERDCAISAVFSGFPSVVTIHGNMRLVAKVTKSPPFSYNWLMGQLEKITLPRSDGVVCITRYTKKAVENLARKTWLIPNAVDGSFFQIERTEAATPIILCVGSICLRKNQNALIEALDELAAKSSFQLVFLGASDAGDPYNKDFFKLVETKPWCRYDGFADREKLKSYLSRATLLALPSLEDNCPMVVLEAMAAGLPVAAANVGGVPELVKDSETGALFDPTSRPGIEASVARLLKDVDLTRHMAKVARERAVERFQPRVIAQQHLKVYEEVLQTRS
jgi:glycosyltransferase involved in cell wall biosynthesis